MTISAKVRENRKAWVRALRSGTFPQDRGALKSDAGYCCLGVACEVIPEGLTQEPYSELDGERFAGGGIIAFRSGDDEARTGVLPRITARALGFNRSNPSVQLEPSGVRSLASLNDSGNYTFDQIADIIESQDDDWDGTEYTV